MGYYRATEPCLKTMLESQVQDQVTNLLHNAFITCMHRIVSLGLNPTEHSWNTIFHWLQLRHTPWRQLIVSLNRKDMFYPWGLKHVLPTIFQVTYWSTCQTIESQLNRGHRHIDLRSWYEFNEIPLASRFKIHNLLNVSSSRSLHKK